MPFHYDNRSAICVTIIRVMSCNYCLVYNYHYVDLSIKMVANDILISTNIPLTRMDSGKSITSDH